MKHSFASGFDKHFGNGVCGTGFLKPVGFPITVSQKTATELSRLSLQDDGFKVLLDAWDAGTNRRFNPKKKAWWFEKSQNDKMTMRCKRDVWAQLSSNLISRGPSCWRKKGYYGTCESLSEVTCRERRGCQWNPIVDVKLIDDVEPAIMATKDGRRSLPVYKDKFTRIKAASARSHGVFAANYARAVTDNMLESEVEVHAGRYRRSSLSVKAQKTYIDSRLLPQIDTLQRNEKMAVLAAASEPPVGAKGSCPTNGGAFQAMHNDLVVDGMRNLYFAAMSDAGNQDTRTGLYHLEMANFWCVSTIPTQISFFAAHISRLHRHVRTLSHAAYRASRRLSYLQGSSGCESYAGQFSRISSATARGRSRPHRTGWISHMPEKRRRSDSGSVRTFSRRTRIYLPHQIYATYRSSD